MHVASNPLPQTSEIQFQISLLKIASLGEAERQTQELEQMLAQHSVQENR